MGSVNSVTVTGLLFVGFAIFFCFKKRKAYHKMHLLQHYGDQDALKITLENLHVGGSESGLSGSHAHVVL